MKKIFLACIIFIFTNMHAQQSIVSSGGTYRGNAGMVSFTVGQVGYGYSNNGNPSISEGIQQVFINSNSSQIKNTTICALVGSTAKFFVNFTNALSYSWEYKAPNSIWKTITNANAGSVYSNFNSSTLNINKSSSQPINGTLYRVIIGSANGNIISNEATITISQTSIAGSILGSTGIICNNSGKIITLSSSHRGAIQWQSSNLSTGSFTDIIGETNSTLNTGNLSSYSFYRAVLTNGMCPSVTTKNAKVSVYPPSNAGIISGGNLSVCPSINSTKLTLTGYIGKIQWQYSTDNENFFNVSDIGNKSTYTAKNLTNTTYYRVLVTNGTSSCIPAISESVSLIVKPLITAGTISGENSVCYNTASILNISDYQIGSNLQWKKSTSINGTYTIPSNTISSTETFNTTNLKTSTYFKVFINYDGCTVSTEAYKVNTLKALPGSITGGSDISNASCVGSTSELLLTGYEGTNIQWYKSTKPTTDFLPISEATSPIYNVQNSTIGKTFYKASVNYPNCPPVFSAVSYINVLNCSNIIARESTFQNWDAIAYPNPYSNEFMLKIDSLDTKEMVQIRIFDVVGKLIDKYDLTPSELESFKFGQNYASGFYEVSISQNKSRTTIKIIKE